ncbi:aldose 1-epimerase [candidate division KSB1 bacterium]
MKSGKMFIITVLIFTSILSNFCGKPMEKTSQFSYSVLKDENTDWSVVTLKYTDQKDASQSKVVKICPEGGANLFYMKFGEHEVIKHSPELNGLKNRKFGTPVLYPTPSIVNNARYTFMGQEIHQVKNGIDRIIHGLVYDEQFEFEEPVITNDGVTLKTHLTINEHTHFFPSFPFKNRIRLNFTLKKDKIHFEYEVENLDDKVFAYGFALHPFFVILGERKDNFIQVDVEKAFDWEGSVPNGKLFDIKGTDKDISKLISIDKLDLDDVYYRVEPETMVRVVYKTIGMQILLKASEDFTHMVVYVPKDKDLFCVENYTCPTDAHNLYAKGFKDITNLLFVKPGEKRGGWIEFIPEQFE